jgi:glycosyltransferase involved in cell wall biosynthesis/putative flippase GtrA
MTLIRYLLVGVVNMISGLSIIYLAMYYLQLEVGYANALGYAIGVLLSFMLNKKWTFKSSNHALYSLMRFILVLLVAYAANLVTVLFILDKFQVNPYIAQALGIIPYTFIGFLGSRYFVFQKQQCAHQSKSWQPQIGVKTTSVITRPIDLSIVVPCYNEEDVLSETTHRLSNLFQTLINQNKISAKSRVYFVDDGSRDRTWELIESLAEIHPLIHGIKLSRNRGHQNALLAGLLTAEGEVIISIDADLQDDLNAIAEMIEAYCSGYDIVYGIRGSRDTDTLFKKFTAQAYYFLLNRMGVEVVFNHADYRLMSRKAIEALREFGEVNLFLRGIIPQLGFAQSSVYYDRAERFAGESKYPLGKMLALAWQGITSFSDIPLRFITLIGLSISLISFIISGWAIFVRLFTEEAIPGWASTVLPIYFLGGIQLLCLGIIGEYLAKVYYETKNRPRFIIDKII